MKRAVQGVEMKASFMKFGTQIIVISILVWVVGSYSLTIVKATEQAKKEAVQGY